MQDSTFLYADFILTIQRLSHTIKTVLQKECSSCPIKDITLPQALYMHYLVNHKTFRYLEDKKTNRKNLYYTTRKLSQAGYITAEMDGKFIIAIHSTKKGQIIIDKLDEIFDKQLKQLLFKGMALNELSHILTLIYRFEKFWLNILKNKE